MRKFIRMRRDMILEFETNMIEEQERTKVLHDQLQETKDRLIRVLR